MKTIIAYLVVFALIVVAVIFSPALSMDYQTLLIVLVGLYACAASIFDWEFFMGHRRAQFFVRLLGGRQRARYLYFSLGIAAILFGLFYNG